jgi:hypothetical protein
VYHLDDIRNKMAQILVVSLVRTGGMTKRKSSQQERYRTPASDKNVQAYILATPLSMAILVGKKEHLEVIWGLEQSMYILYEDFIPQPADPMRAIVPFVPKKHFFLDQQRRLFIYLDVLCPNIPDRKFLRFHINNLPFWATPGYTSLMVPLECPTCDDATFEEFDLTDDELPHWITPAFKWVREDEILDVL